ncbi:hypothetical protein [Pseudomonas sp. 43NM1]|uniref:hypothetical protein n=1 Tax=Pseudomonas sp. 43NM1 TaxID=1904755 RepID=UPI0012FF5A22|nr:hypothetical protein [Pseudomonas sp. 43NM1]
MPLLGISNRRDAAGRVLVRWIERSHTVSLSDVFRWLVANGDAAVMRAENQSRP